MKKLTDNLIFLNLKRQHTHEQENKKDKEDKRKAGNRRVKYKSKSLNLLNDKLLAKSIKSKPYRDINVPTVFSIIDNPKETLKLIKQVATYSRIGVKVKGLSINHFNTKSIDIAAESVLGLTIKEMDREIKSHNRKLKITGHYPKDPYIKRFIKAVGIIKNLEIKHEYLSKEEEQDLKIFNMRNSQFQQKDNIDQSDYKEKTVTEFVDYINSCLVVNGRELTLDAISLLADYTGEIIGNVEDHTDLNDWSIVGYLDNNHKAHSCEITIFNFGNTMSSTLKNLPIDNYTKKIITPYIDLHSKSGWFSEDWNEDDLLTLIALQGDISSKNTNKDMDRGQGTVEMIEFFQQMHKECIKADKSCARMAILSGSTHILFDGTYDMSLSNNRKIIAFNKDNDLNNMPDKKYVTNLNNIFFPGTIISIRFPLLDTQTQEA